MHRRLTLLALAVALAACLPSVAPTPSATGVAASPSATPPIPGGSGTPSDPVTPASATPAAGEPIPSGALGEFTCDLPIIEAGTTARANIVDVRDGTHDGYDRVVFEFVSGTPELTLDRAEPPFTQDGSGFPIEVEGEAFLGIVMRGGTKQTESGESSYDGPTNFDPRFTRLVDIVEGGDFEAQSTWYLGLTEDACVRLLVLDEPPRVVIDIEH